MSTSQLPARDETLIRGAWVLPMSGKPDVRGGAVHIRGGEIVAVGDYETLRSQQPQATVVGAGTGIVVPGFVNTHTHLSEAFLAGLGSELPLFMWGQEIVSPSAEHLTRDMAREGAILKSAEMLHSGITTVNDMFVHANQGSGASLGAVDGLEAAGLRGVVSFGAEDVPAGVSAAPSLAVEAVLEEQSALEQRTASTDLVGFRYGIGTLLGQSDTLLQQGIALCQEKGWAVHTHLAEVKQELVEAEERWGRRTIDQAEALQLLDLPLIVAHVIWVTEADVALLGEREVSVAHNPVANMILGSGVCPVGQLREAGIPVGVGTDGAASNDSQNMLEAVKATALLQKVHNIDPSVISANDALAMATIEGARALGMDSTVGSLEPGKRADVVLVEGTVEMANVHDPYQKVVYCSSPRAVSDVWVDGRRLLADRRLVSIGEEEQVQRCRLMAEELAVKSGLTERGWSSITEPSQQ